MIALDAVAGARPLTSLYQGASEGKSVLWPVVEPPELPVLAVPLVPLPLPVEVAPLVEAPLPLPVEPELAGALLEQPASAATASAVNMIRDTEPPERGSSVRPSRRAGRAAPRAQGAMRTPRSATKLGSESVFEPARTVAVPSTVPSTGATKVAVPAIGLVKVSVAPAVALV